MKNFKSIADSNNYGDDVTAAYLLYPPNSQSLGVEPDDFTAERSKEDLFQIFNSVSGSTPQLLEQAWALGTMRRGGSTALSLLEFRSVFNELLD